MDLLLMIGGAIIFAGGLMSLSVSGLLAGFLMLMGLVVGIAGLVSNHRRHTGRVGRDRHW